MIVEPFEKYWLDYDAWYDRHRELYYSELMAVELASRGVLRPWLEIGVGTGRFAAPLRIDIGVDPSDAMLRVAASRGVRVVKACGEDLPFQDSSFGGVFMIVTLCFLNDPIKALREAHRVLTLRGKLILGFVPADSAWGRYYAELGREGHKFYKYAKFYAVCEIEDLLRATGFKPELYISTLIKNKPGSLEVLEDPVVGLKREAGFVVLRAKKAT
jgi:ubiquinone/menaquinone biosynthesis C-methylase UbiE